MKLSATARGLKHHNTRLTSASVRPIGQSGVNFNGQLRHYRNVAANAAAVLEAPSQKKPQKIALAKISASQQMASCGLIGALVTFVGVCPYVTPQLDCLRPMILSYLTFSAVEYVYHRWGMHAAPTPTMAMLTMGRNKVHLDHHGETPADRYETLDMDLPEGYDRDALYFHYPTVIVTLGVSAAMLLLENAIGHFNIPTEQILLTAAISTALYSTGWNTLHADSHNLELDITDGPPAIKKPYPLSGTPVVDWLLRNHTVHHTSRGRGNFNIVCPIFDHVTGVYYYVADEEPKQQ